MTYTFSHGELDYLRDLVDNNPFGVRDAYRFYHALTEDTAINTTDVEDFAIAFYTQYNKTFGMRY
jgi:hypothetical protein